MTTIQVPDFVSTIVGYISTMASDRAVHVAGAALLQSLKSKYPQYSDMIDYGTMFLVATTVSLSAKKHNDNQQSTETK